MGEVGITPIPAPESDLDFGVAWHFGDPHREQRILPRASNAPLHSANTAGMVSRVVLGIAMQQSC